MLALVLGGGGAKGSYEIGIWKALIDLDVKFNIVTGTSIGSFNSALISQGDFKRALDAWYNFDAGKMFNIKNYDAITLKEKTRKSLIAIAKDAYKNGGSDIEEYRKTIEKYIDENSVRNSKVKMGLVTVEMKNLKGVELSIDDIPSGNLADFIMASSSISLAIKPQEINGKKYIDGCYHDNIPISLAKNMGADRFIAVDLGMFFSFGTKINKFECPENIKYISPYWDLGNILVFDKDIVKKNIQQGYYDVMKKYGVFDGNAYTFIKGDIEDDYLLRFKKFLSDKYNKSIISKVIKMEYKSLILTHNSKGTTIVNDSICILEILCEILEIDYTKIYSKEKIYEIISKKIEKIEISDFKIDTINDFKGIIDNVIDSKKMLKFFIIKIKEDKNLAFDNFKILSMLYSKEFFASIYAIVYNLV